MVYSKELKDAMVAKMLPPNCIGWIKMSESYRVVTTAFAG